MGEVNLSAMWWCPFSLEQATGNLHSGTKMGEIQEVRIPDIFRFLNMETTVHVLVWSYFSLLSETTRNVFHVFELFLPCIVWDLMFLQQWVLSLLSYGPWHCVISQFQHNMNGTSPWNVSNYLPYIPENCNFDSFFCLCFYSDGIRIFHL